ncbi:MAG: methyltransferase domain-containing protein [Candidatus Eremiobacteraeota bacterium]|nr:methyltransferase domain-containing protein [Candidatus Eremiobacteraeota bacterium]
MCASGALELRVPLAPIPIATPNFSVPAGLRDRPEFRIGVPLDLYQCAQCGHVQVGVIGNPDYQYRDYVYTTSVSLGLAEHFASYARETLDRLAVPPGSLVVEIGSNDGTLLRNFKAAGMRVVGVDPAKRIAEAATASGIETVAEFWNAATARAVRERFGRASLIIANNVIANVPNLLDFGEGIADALAPQGAFVFETQYGADVVERRLVDTIYHEHISYFLTDPTKRWLEEIGLEMLDVSPVATKGGSMRVTAQRRGGGRAANPSVDEWIARERASEMFGDSFFAQLSTAIAKIGSELQALVERSGEAAGFGVSVGTTTMLAQFGLYDKIAFLVDDDPNKERALTGPGYAIDVLPPAALLERRPPATVVFAWRYADAIASKHRAYLDAGGRFVVPLPSVREVPRAG